MTYERGTPVKGWGLRSRRFESTPTKSISDSGGIGTVLYILVMHLLCCVPEIVQMDGYRNFFPIYATDCYLFIYIHIHAKREHIHIRAKSD